MKIYKLILLILLIASVAIAQTYQIDWYVIGSGGGHAESGTYQVDGTIGQPIVGQASSDNYTVDAGFWIGAGTSGPDCYEYMAGDANMANGLWKPMVLGADVTFLVNYFKGSPASNPCLVNNPSAGNPYFWASADANGDCIVMGSDVIKLVGYFRGAQSIMWCADYEPCWHPTGAVGTPAPETAPPGWPNCETPAVTSKVLPADNSK